MTLRPIAGLAGLRRWVVAATRDRRWQRPDPAPLKPSRVLDSLRRFCPRPAPLPRSRRLAWTLGAIAVMAALWWLDSPNSPVALDQAPELRHAAFFGGVVAALELLAGWIATAAEVTAAATWVALQWLAATTAAFLVSTGAMFARIWDALKIVYSDVLKPALIWVDDHLKRFYDWMQRTFRPVFDFLRDVRDRLEKFYKTFIRPVTDTIEFVRQVNRVLMTFHIDVLNALDRTLQQIEQRIDEPFLWITEKLNEVTNWINRIVTVDGLFQRLTLLRSLAKHADGLANVWWNSQIRDPNLRPRYPEGPVPEPMGAAGLSDALAEYFDNETGPLSEPADRFAALVLEELG